MIIAGRAITDAYTERDRAGQLVVTLPIVDNDGQEWVLGAGRDNAWRGCLRAIRKDTVLEIEGEVVDPDMPDVLETTKIYIEQFPAMEPGKLPPKPDESEFF